MNSLEIKNLRITHQNKDAELTICDSVSLEFNAGEIIGIFGPNGSGKSTLLRTILELNPVEAGKIFINSVEGEQALTSKVSYIPQDIVNSFFSWASVKRNILLASQDQKKSENNLEELWKEFNINFENKLSPGKCSGGMLQQAAIVRSFINSPKIIIADEPFSALDVATLERIRFSFRKKVKELNSIAIIALHNLDDLLAICDKIVVIPNKPFSSEKLEGYHQLKIYQNKEVGNSKHSEKENSIVSIFEKLLN